MPGWADLTLVTDADIAAIEPASRANQNPPPWGATTWPSARAEAKRELKILVETAFPTIVGAADRILDRHRPDWVFAYNGSSYTDVTAKAVDDEEKDVDLTTIFATSSGKLYVGADYQFEGLFLKFKDALNAVARTITVKYSGAAGWTALAATDGTAVAGAPFGQSGRVTWTMPSAGWQRIRLATTGAEYFWVELSLSGALSSGSCQASQILPIRAPDGLKRVATLLALHYIMNGLERQAANPDEWAAKATVYYDMAIALFDRLKEGGGLPLDRTRDEVVSQPELEETEPIRLGRA